MGATEKEDTAPPTFAGATPPPTFAGATPQYQPIKSQKSGGRCRRFAFLHAVSRVICCSNIELGAREAKKGGWSGLGNAHVCCSNVEYDSDVEDNQEIKGGGEVDMENVFFCCSSVDLKKKEKK